jgi:hypothetical protein
MSERYQLLEGSCHCGAVSFEFKSPQGLSALAVRACQCRFCRGHGARTTSDPKGSVRFFIRDASKLNRYRFGLHSADFLICGNCGVYVGAVIASSRGQFATLNINTLHAPTDAPTATSVSYEGESLEQKQARREQHWTPVIEAI